MTYIRTKLGVALLRSTLAAIQAFEANRVTLTFMISQTLTLV